MFRAGIASPVLAVLFRKGGVGPGTARLVAASQGGHGLLRLGGVSCGVVRPVGFGVFWFCKLRQGAVGHG